MGRPVALFATPSALFAARGGPVGYGAVGAPVGYSEQELAACLARMRDARPDLLANAIRREPVFFGQPFTIPPHNIIADVLDTNTSAMSDAYITRAVVLYADAILSSEAVPSAWPGPMLRADGRTAPRTTFAVEAWKQRLVLGLSLGLRSPTLRGAYAEAIMSVCRGWRTVYAAKPAGIVAEAPANVSQRSVYGRAVPRMVYGAVRPAGWTDAATVGTLRTVSSIAGTTSNLLRGDQQIAALEASLASQRAALDAQMAASVSRAEGATVTQRLQLQMAREQREAQIANTERELLSLRAQVQAVASVAAAVPTPSASAPPASASAPPASTGSGAGWALALAVLAAAGVGVAVVVTRRRKSR